jgi:predicted phosphodiesterase
MLYRLNSKYQCYFIRGNKEDYWLKYYADGEVRWKDNNSTTGALLYAFNSLTNKDIEFYKKLQIQQKVTLGNLPQILICHGSPYNANEKMLPNDTRTNHILDSVNQSIIICGHTHVQQKIIQNNKCVLNPGSVGIPLYSQGKTQFLILHGNNGVWNEEFLSLDYNVDKVINELYEVKLNEKAPCWSLITEYILRNGTISHGNVLLRAMELCEEDNGSCKWPEIPEKYWAKAVYEKLGLRKNLLQEY